MIDTSYYIGITGNVQNRLHEHNFGRTGYTKSKRPWELIYWEEYPTLGEAAKREKQLKSCKSRMYLRKLIEVKMGR